ncbi:hypothetical protein ACIOZM_08135 [Pseudomonas sp. NPDC087346]|uniref:hypothetical protein n=1 Tax=Pseudomonas sp. NPDC087346 TaxID=3364438 RepID=UPI0038051FB2
MPWLRGGTVAVTSGSTTVVGTNADFAANSRTGDAFIGPDGISYEIGNVASATVISIIPAYKGPTASGVAYAIMPVQGYPKALADAFNNINLQWGPTLAALGTTGNYDVLPVSKGGTGGVDQADGRAGLGLGSAATENVIPVTKGGTGGTDQASARAGLGLGSVAVENTVPVTKGGTGGTDQASARVGLGLGTAAIAAILGTVSQSGGIPTGDVMQAVTNANGTAFKLASGVMLCLSPPLTVAGTTASFGALFISPTATGWFYPVAFVGASPYVGGTNGNSAQFSINSRTTSISSAEFVGIYPASSSGALTVFAFAIGRWF